MAEKRLLNKSFLRSILSFALGLFIVLNVSEIIPAFAAGAKARYQISQNTLDHLKREGLPENLLISLESLLNKQFPSREIFLGEIAKHSESPIADLDRSLLLQYSAMDQLKIRAESFSSNQKNQESVFRGNVHGEIPRENINFSTAKLRMLVGEKNNYERLIGEGGVRIIQWDREMRADFLNYTRSFEDANEDEANPKPIAETLLLEGSVLLSSYQGNTRSNTLKLDVKVQKAELEGKLSESDGRVRLEAYPDRFAKETRNLTDTDAVKPPSREIILLAARASLDNSKRRLNFVGEVEMERNPEGLFVTAGTIQIYYDENQSITQAQASESVCIEQPGRVARADFAHFDEIEQIIRLEGNAEVDSGKYNLKGPIIKVYLDVTRGVVQGDSETPIHMTMKMGGDSSSQFNCQ